MGKKYDLSAAKKRQIEQCLGQGMKTLDNSRKLKHDHRTVKRFVADLEYIRACADKGRMRKVSAVQICRIMRAAAKMPLQSSKQVFEAAGASGVPQTSRCRILQKLAVVHKPTIRPPLTNAHKQKRWQWAHPYMKTNFQTVLFTDECRVTLDGPDGWRSGWLVDGHHVPTRLRRQQGGGGVMFWAGIMGRELVGPLGSLKVWKWPRQSISSFWLTTFFNGTKRRTVPSAAKSSSCMTMHHLMLQRIPLCHWLLWA